MKTGKNNNDLYKMHHKSLQDAIFFLCNLKRTRFFLLLFHLRNEILGAVFERGTSRWWKELNFLEYVNFKSLHKFKFNFELMTPFPHYDKKVCSQENLEIYTLMNG